MRVKSAATAEEHRGIGQAVGGLPGGGQRHFQLGPAASGGHHPLIGLHGGGANHADDSRIPLAKDPISCGEGHQLGPKLPGGHDGRVSQVALPSSSP